MFLLVPMQGDMSGDDEEDGDTDDDYDAHVFCDDDHLSISVAVFTDVSSISH